MLHIAPPMNANTQCYEMCKKWKLKAFLSDWSIDSWHMEDYLWSCKSVTTDDSLRDYLWYDEEEIHQSFICSVKIIHEGIFAQPSEYCSQFVEEHL